MGRAILVSSSAGRWSPYAIGLRNYAVLRYAQEFHSVAVKAGSPIVRAYLLGHALELYLKAYLHSNGLGITEMKQRYGHSLEKLLHAAETNGLNTQVHISSALREDLIALHAIYHSKALEYFSLLHLIVPPKLPGLTRLFRFATALRKVNAKRIPTAKAP